MSAYLKIKSLLELCCAISQACGKSEEKDRRNHLDVGLQKKTRESSHEAVDNVPILLSIRIGGRSIFVIVATGEKENQGPR